MCPDLPSPSDTAARSRSRLKVGAACLRGGGRSAGRCWDTAMRRQTSSLAQPVLRKGRPQHSARHRAQPGGHAPSTPGTEGPVTASPDPRGAGAVLLWPAPTAS